MPLIYGEGRKEAFQRLRETINKSLKGTKYEDFSISFSLSDVSGIDYFVAREEELMEIHRTLSSDGSRRTIVLHGLGGIGKTQLSLAYAKRHKDNYSAILWLNMKDEHSLKQSFANSAKQILRQYPLISQLRSLDIKGNLDKVVDGVKAWLSLPNNTRWLMIYDNYDNPKLAGNTDPTALNIREFLPESYQGSVIITTRSSQVTISYRMPITKLKNVQDSLEIMLNASNRQGLRDNSDALRLAKELDGSPLALATAGAYLYHSAISFSDYLRLYKESWAKLQKTTPELSSYEDRTLYSTWQVSYTRIEQRNSLSAKLLRFWAYFDNQDLWFELLRHCSSEDPEWIQEIVKDELSFHSAMRILSDHGLVEVDTSSQELVESRGYSIHGCLHSWIVHFLNQEWDFNLSRVALNFVGLHVPGEAAIQSWLTQRRLLQHADRCSYLVLNGLVTKDGIALACNKLGNLYRDQGKLAEAEPMYQRALNGREKALGPEHTLTLKTVNNLGILYSEQGKLGEAEQMFQRALKGKEKALGPDHASTLDTVNNLGVLYSEQGKLAEAKQMYQRALKGRETALGPEHTSTLDTVNNLGVLYIDQGKLAEAKEMYQRALNGYEKALGPEHTSTLDTVNNLGVLYIDQGKLAEAEQMYQRALKGYEKALGADHVTTYLPALTTVRNLGSLFERQADIGKARTMYSRALGGFEIAVGADDSRSQTLRDRIRALDVETENGSLGEVGEPVDKFD